MSIRVWDMRDETIHEFLFSNMKKYIRKNILEADKYWKLIVKDIIKSNKMRTSFSKKPDVNIFYSYYKKYDDGNRGVIRAKTIDGVDNPREFYKEVEANTDTAKGIYWMDKEIFFDLNEQNIINITFHVTGLYHAFEDDGRDYVRECAFFELDDFIEKGYYRGDKIYIREEDVGQEITFKNNAIEVEE